MWRQCPVKDAQVDLGLSDGLNGDASLQEGEPLGRAATWIQEHGVQGEAAMGLSMYSGYFKTLVFHLVRTLFLHSEKNHKHDL